MDHRRRVRTRVLFCAVLATVGRVVDAAVSTDGSVGPARTLAGPNFAVTPDLGKQAGGNLFHSFSRFDLVRGETATFSGPSSGPAVHNVLARVTGGTASSINGTIRCTIPAANFYLVNPAGVVFGPDASLDVQGSFAVTTANYLRLADGGRFAATASPADSVLTTAAPAAFGFLNSAAPKPVTVDGQSMFDPEIQDFTRLSPDLRVQTGRVLSVVGGPIRIAGGGLTAPGGRVNLVAAGAAGEVALDPADPAGPVVMPGSLARADVQLTGAKVATDGPGGGGTVVRAAGLTLADSLIFAQTVGPDAGGGPGRGINIGLISDLSLVTSAVVTSTAGPGRGGDVDVAARDIVLDGRGTAQFTGVAAQTAAADPAGVGGDVRVSARDVRVLGTAEISTATGGAAAAGSVTVTADSLGLDGVSQVSSQANAEDAAGRAGAVRLRAHTVDVRGGSSVNAVTCGPGAGGNVDIVADSVRLDAGRQVTEADADAPTTDIAATSLGTAPGSGNAGNVTIRAGTLQIVGSGTEISARTDGPGTGGNIIIDARTVLVDGQAGPFFSGIGANTQGTTGGGRGGNIRVHAGDLRLVSGGSISALTAGDGDGGSIAVSAGRILFDERDAPGFTGIGATTRPPDPTDPAAAAATTGRGGDVAVRAGTLTILNGAQVSTTSRGAGDAGDVRLTCGRLMLDRQGSSFRTGVLAETRDAATGGAGGDVFVAARTVNVAGGAEVSATTFGPGRGGRVLIDAGTVDVSGSATISSSASGAGTAGSLTVRAARDVRLWSGGVISVRADAADAGRIRVDAGRDVVVVGPGRAAAAPAGITGITAEALRGSGGDAEVRAGRLIYVRHGTVTGMAGGNGGRITFDPPAVVLDNSTINGLAGGTPVVVRIDTPDLLMSASKILTNTPQNFPNTDLSGSLLALPAGPADAAARLAPQCGLRLGGDVSSFLLTGRGGEPPAPGGWTLDSGGWQTGNDPAWSLELHPAGGR